jgi:hypothetical protein
MGFGSAGFGFLGPENLRIDPSLVQIRPVGREIWAPKVGGGACRRGGGGVGALACCTMAEQASPWWLVGLGPSKLGWAWGLVGSIREGGGAP